MDEFRRKPVNRLNPNTNAAPTPAQQNIMPQVPEPTPSEAPYTSAHAPQPIGMAQEGGVSSAPASKPPKRPKKKRIVWGVGIVVAILAIVSVVGVIWYTVQLSPVNSGDTSKKLVRIQSGSGPTAIANVLAEEGVIRNQTAFLWYTRLEGVQGQLQAGSYRLSPSESTQDIVTHLTNGKVDTFDITFLPGETLADSRKAFINAGYTAAEVDAAFTASYSSPLFADKPASADLEGYIYGDTYRFGAGTSVEDILEHVFGVFYGVVEKNNLVDKFKENGLNLYQGITLASIIQRESIGGDEPQIAQVFYTRLSIGMMLGSDVTYQYIADKTGVARDINLDSPYNTRRYTGLPPGPIATPGLNALLAVASPAPGDYIYFLSGDDDVTYFATTLEEHEANIRNHCQQKCQII